MFVPSAVRAELKEVWVTDDGTRLSATGAVADRDRLDVEQPPVGPEKRRHVRLFAEPNETVAIQVVLEGGERATDVSVSLASIGAIKNVGVGDDADHYFAGRSIEMFEAYPVTLRNRSHDLTWKPGSNAEPAIDLGSVFEPLAPLGDSIAVPARRRRVVWIDVWVAPDTTPGHHRGELRIDGGEGAPTVFKLDLEVGKHPLPHRPHTKTMLWSSVAVHEHRYVHSRYFESSNPIQREQLRRRHHQLAHRHRLTLINGKYQGDPTVIEPYASGRLYSKEMGYSGPGEGQGDDLFVFHAYGGKLTRQEATRWHEALIGYPQKPQGLLYVVDEPRLDAKMIAKINAAAMEARPIGALVTTAYDPRLNIDAFLALAENYRRSDATAARATGKQPWIYNGVRPFSGSFAIDDVAISPRVNPWIQYRDGIERWYYWEATYYEDFQGKRGQVDVWKEAGNFTNRHGDAVNGDGLLFYPGRDRHFPDSDRGVMRPLPSVRLKNWRRGIEDVEYLYLAKAKGGEVATKALALVKAMVPKALDQVKKGDAVSWPEDGRTWRLARRYLFDLIENGESSIDPVDFGPSKRPLPPKTRPGVNGSTGSRRCVSSRYRYGLIALLVVGGALIVMWRRRG